jgi:hypothetical protein
MDNAHHEPIPPAPRPCSTPHSAPAAWLKGSPGPCPSAAPPAPPPTEQLPASQRQAIIDQVFADPELLADILARAAASAAPPATRHDGWTGERMARFLEVLADTGIVTEACRAVGMNRDSAYALRNRDPVFAAAWAAAQSKARPLVADGILERSITGTVEHYYRDGVLVGERRHYESWLALAVLKRLDKQAEADRADGTLSAKMAEGWQATLDMLRAGGTDAVATVLGGEPDKADIPPSPFLPGEDPWENVWQNDDGVWMTVFAPPPGFDGYENRPFDGFAYYERACTPDEVDLIEANRAAAEAEEQAEAIAFAEEQREAFFAMVRAEIAAFKAPDSSPDSRYRPLPG